MAVVWPEQYTLPSSTHVPNSVLPVLIYRNVLPVPIHPEITKDLCEKNGWEKRVGYKNNKTPPGNTFNTDQGEWGEIRIPHFHPNTHECYAIIRGNSCLVLGRAKEDGSNDGVEIDISMGDVIIIPAGVSHRSLRSGGEFRYIGVYPKAAPRWRNNHCDGKESMDALCEEIRSVPVPEHDPVFGFNGPLTQIWNSALVGARAKI